MQRVRGSRVRVEKGFRAKGLGFRGLILKILHDPKVLYLVEDSGIVLYQGRAGLMTGMNSRKPLNRINHNIIPVSFSFPFSVQFDPPHLG